jgi:anaerobic magnesium-protoporphyrin IX monomethyl ester cyclase
MRVLLIAGLGPSIKNTDLLAGSSFATAGSGGTHSVPPVRRPYDLSRLRVRDDAGSYRLLRPYDPLRPSSPRDGGVVSARTREFPHLTTLTLQTILRRVPVEVCTYPAERVWADGDGEPTGPFDLILISTTFIWERRSLRRAIGWARDRYPSASLILGGQYSNIKYRQILAAHPEVSFIVRGDAEHALPGLLHALAGQKEVSDVPNLVWRDADTGNLRATPLGYADLDAEPSPSPAGPAPVVPYESMRGCPFQCKFCSFPAASPQWRYKSAGKIRDDFARYRDENGTQFVKALDSTFTVPLRRLREVLPLLGDLGVRWEAYTRANALRDARTMEALSAGHCASLAIGFESMSDAVLGFMNKQVTASANRTAFRLLQDTEIDYRASFMVGYPGETPEHHEETRRFLAEEYRGRFSMYVFSLSDETMPVWQDAERFGLRVLDEDRPDDAWTHVGMDHATAHRLQRDTLREVRWRNDNAVLNLWQGAYEMPLAPTRSEADNLRIEKLIERLGMLCVDAWDETETAQRTVAVFRALRALGVDHAQPGDVLHGPPIPTNR